LGDTGIYGKIILEWIINKWDVRVRTEFIWLMTGTSGRLL